MAAAKIPYLINFSPSADEIISGLNPDINLYWSIHMDQSEFSDDTRRNELVRLIKVSNGDSLTTVFDSYDQRTLCTTLTVSGGLETGESYQFIINEGAKDYFGRRTAFPTTWTFSVEGTDLDLVEDNILPANYESYSTAPTFTWASVSSSALYEFQLDDNYTMEAPLLTQASLSTSYTPNYSYVDDTTYYWRVRAYSVSATGAWSDVRAFYYGDPVYVSTLDPINQSALLVSFGAETGQGNLGSWPNLTITLSMVPSAGYSSYLEFTKEKVLPRNDVSGEYDKTAVSGSWALNGRILTFTPSESIAENTKYLIKVKEGLTSITGVPVLSDYYMYFTGTYTPLYCGIRLLQSKLGFESGNYPEDFLYYHLHVASLEANARYLTMVGISFNNLSEELLRSESREGHAVVRWVEAAARYNLICTILNERLRYVGTTTKLGDYSESTTRDFIQAIVEAKKTAQEDLQSWSELLEFNDSGPRKSWLNVNWHESFNNGSLYVGKDWQGF